MDAIDLFERDEQRRNLTEKTISGRHNVVAAFNRWCQANAIDLTQATRDDIQRWLDELPIVARTRASYLGSLRAFYHYCYGEGLSPADPTVLIARPRTGRLLPRPVSVEALELAISQAAPRMKLWLCLAAFMGLRCMEIAQLAREDIFEDAHMPALVIKGKGDKDRMLPMNANVERALHSCGLPDRGWLFPVLSGRHIRPATVSGEISTYFSDLGYKATAHQLRHFFGSKIYDVTGDIRIAQEMLGHSSPKTTAIYVQYDAARAAQAMRALSIIPEAV